MADILVRPPELRWTADQIRQRVNVIQKSLDATDAIIKSLGASRFESARADALRERYLQLRDQVYSFRQLLTQFSNELDEVSFRFEAADRAASRTDL